MLFTDSRDQRGHRGGSHPGNDRCVRDPTPKQPPRQASAEWIARLPAEQYPTLVALAADLTDADVEARFRFGLDVLVAGLLAQGR